VAKVKQLAAEIVLRDKTGKGAESASDSFEKVGDSADKAGKLIEKTTKVNRSAARAYQSLQRRLDPLAAAQERLKRDQRSLSRAQEQGVITTDSYQRNLKQLNRQFDRTKDKLNRNQRAQRGLNREMGAFRNVAGAARGAIIGFIAAFSFERIISGARAAASVLDDIAKKARSFGGIESAEFLQTSSFALGQLGFDPGQADKLLITLNKRVGELNAGFGALKGPIQQIRPELAGLLKQADTGAERFKVFIDQLSKIEDQGARSALAAAAFDAELGKKAGALGEAGLGVFERLQQEAKDVGLVFEKDVLERAEKLNDRFSKATHIIGVQMKKAFIEVAPIVAGILEATAKFTVAIANGVESIRQNNINPAGVEELSTALSLVNSIENDIVNLENSQKRTSLTGRDTTALDLSVERQRRRLELARDQVAFLEISTLKISDIREAIGAGPDPLADSFNRRLKTLRLFESQLQSQFETLKFDFSKISGDPEKIVNRFKELIPNITNDQLEQLKPVATAIAALTGEIKKAETAAKKTGAALKKAFDPVGDLQTDNNRLKELIEAAGLGSEELANTEQRFRIEDQIARVKLAAARAGVVLSKEQLDIERKLLEENENLLKELDTARSSGRGADGGFARDFVDPLARELDSVADNFVDRLVRDGRLGFREMGRNLKEILLESVLNPFRLALRNLLSGAFGGVGGSVQGGAGAIAGATGISGLISRIAPAAAGGFFGLNAGQSVSNLLGLKKGGLGRGLVSGGIGGAVGGAVAGLTIGAAAGPIGAIAGLVIGGLVSLFKGPPSNKVGQTVFDPVSGRSFGSDQKDASDASNQNLKIAKEIASAISDQVGAIARITGADLRNDPATAFRDDLINVAAGNRDGIRIGFQGPGGAIAQAQRFDNSEAGARAAIDAGVAQTIQALKGGNAALVDIAQELARAGEPVDDIVGRLQTLKSVLDATTTPVDEFKQRLDVLNEAFTGLNTSSGALGGAFNKAIDQLAGNLNEQNQRVLDEFLNPRLAQLNTLTEQLNARRDAAGEIAGEGGNVDFGLLDEINRRTVLATFNIDQRLAQGADPARASVDDFRQTQVQELAALKSVVGQFGVTASDVASLIRAQAFERNAFFQTLSEDDRLRLAGQSGEFSNLDQKFGLSVERLIESANRLVDGFGEAESALQDNVSARTAERDDFNRAIFDLERSFGQGDPITRLDNQRALVEDLQSRALVETDTADRRLAREQLPQAVRDLVERSQGVNASSTVAQSDFIFGRDVLARVRDRAEQERVSAVSQLETLRQSRDLLEDIRDFLAAPALDALGLSGAAAALPAGFAERDEIISLARDVLEIQKAQFEQSDAINAALERLTLADVSAGDGANQSDPLVTLPARTQPAPFSITNIDPARTSAQTATSGGGSTEGTKDGDIITGLFTLAKRIEESSDQDSQFYDDQKRRDTAIAAILNRIANTL
jgi:hypothetical protein